MKAYVALVVLATLSACIYDGDRFHNRQVSEEYFSPHSAESVANCIAQRQDGPVAITHDETGVYRVEDRNTYGQRFRQWEIAPSAHGSVIRYRKFHLGGSQQKVHDCFEGSPKR